MTDIEFLSHWAGVHPVLAVLALAILVSFALREAIHWLFFAASDTDEEEAFEKELPASGNVIYLYYPTDDLPDEYTGITQIDYSRPGVIRFVDSEGVRHVSSAVYELLERP